MLDIELARTIDQERTRQIEAAARRRRLMEADPMLVETTTADASQGQSRTAPTRSTPPAAPAAIR